MQLAQHCTALYLAVCCTPCCTPSLPSALTIKAEVVHDVLDACGVERSKVGVGGASHCQHDSCVGLCGLESSDCCLDCWPVTAEAEAGALQSQAALHVGAVGLGKAHTHNVGVTAGQETATAAE